MGIVPRTFKLCGLFRGGIYYDLPPQFEEKFGLINLDQDKGDHSDLWEKWQKSPKWTEDEIVSYCERLPFQLLKNSYFGSFFVLAEKKLATDSQSNRNEQVAIVTFTDEGKMELFVCVLPPHYIWIAFRLGLFFEKKEQTAVA